MVCSFRNSQHGAFSWKVQLKIHRYSVQARRSREGGQWRPIIRNRRSIRTAKAGDRRQIQGLIDLLSQLSPCPQISDAQFVLWFHEVVSVGDDDVICVLEDRATRRIVATGSIFVEKKFLHGCGKIGHIEDVVGDNALREKKLGQKVVNYLAEHAKRVGCYKVILNCTPELRGFYENCGFVEKNIRWRSISEDFLWNFFIGKYLFDFHQKNCFSNECFNCNIPWDCLFCNLIDIDNGVFFNELISKGTGRVYKHGKF